MICRCRSVAGEDRLEVGDHRHELVVLVLQPLALQSGEPAQLHVEDGGGLQLVDLEQRHQAGARRFGGLARADQRDDLVDPVLRLEQRRRRMWARSCALRSRNWVRRTMISTWCTT